MKHLNKLLLLFISLALVTGLSAQERYLDEVFTNVQVTADVVYGSNVTVINPDAIGPENLVMDIYEPVGDDVTNRPLVIFLHTGNFLPAIINGQITGGNRDSSVVEMCTRLAKQGYVVASATYRKGWNPLATGPSGQNIRTGTLLNAAYRGIQDARTCIRFFRKSVAENDNPYGVDPEKIVLWGQGTGGYISLGSAFLDSFDEVLLPKFIDTELAQPYVDTTLVGNIFGTSQAAINIPNHVGYSSDFALAVNLGGAVGDSSWINGTAEEPPVISFHSFTDPFAPYLFGPVIVPTTGDFVVNVSGSRGVQDRLSRLGSNGVFQAANDDLTDPINARNKALAQVQAQTILGQPTTLSTDNMYTFVSDTLSSIPYDWWSTAQLTGTVQFLNTALGTDYSVETLEATARLLNPDASKEKALPYIDTIMAYFNPRAYLALNLATSTKEVLKAETVEMTVGPNPSLDVVFVRSAPDKPMKNVALYHMNGKMLRGIMNVNSSTFELHRNGLPPGIYLLQAEFEEGIVTKKIVFKN